MSRTKLFLGGLSFNYANQALVTLVGCVNFADEPSGLLQ